LLFEPEYLLGHGHSDFRHPGCGGTVFDYGLTFDGVRVVYRGDLTTDNVFETYSASTSAAGTPINLSQLGSSTSSQFSISPDDDWVAWTQSDGTTSALWCGLIDGTYSFEAAVSSTLGITDWSWLPDSSGVVFQYEEGGYVVVIQTLNFAAVPETETYGAILGLLGLALALCRRRARV